jgi:hypothetical protein
MPMTTTTDAFELEIILHRGSTFFIESIETKMVTPTKGLFRKPFEITYIKARAK